MTYEDVRSTVLKCISRPLANAGYDLMSVPDGLDLLHQGIIDSFGFMDLMEELETHLGVQFDLTMLDEEGSTTVAGLSRQLLSAATRA